MSQAVKPSNSILTKKRVGMEFEEKTLLEVRRILFTHGLSVNEFFACVAEKACTNDETIMKLIKEAQEARKEKLLNGKDSRKLDIEALYRLIEEQNINRK